MLVSDAAGVSASVPAPVSSVTASVVVSAASSVGSSSSAGASGAGTAGIRVVVRLRGALLRARGAASGALNSTAGAEASAEPASGAVSPTGSAVDPGLDSGALPAGAAAFLAAALLAGAFFAVAFLAGAFLAAFFAGAASAGASASTADGSSATADFLAGAFLAAAFLAGAFLAAARLAGAFLAGAASAAGAPASVPDSGVDWWSSAMGTPRPDAQVRPCMAPPCRTRSGLTVQSLSGTATPSAVRRWTPGVTCRGRPALDRCHRSGPRRGLATTCLHRVDPVQAADENVVGSTHEAGCAGHRPWRVSHMPHPGAVSRRGADNARSAGSACREQRIADRAGLRVERPLRDAGEQRRARQVEPGLA